MPRLGPSLESAQRRSRPQRPQRRRDERGVVVPSWLMLAAIVVVAIAGVMYVATSPKKNSGAANPAGSAQASNSSQPTTPAATPSKTPSTQSSPTPSSAPTKKPAPSVDRGKTFVAVFNNSGRSGLAASTATKATAKGWKVVGTDNWYGSVPSSTVYFPKGMKPAAHLLAKDLGIARVMPAVAPMHSDRLTVILTTSYGG